MRQVEYLQECQLLHTLVLEGNPMDRLEAYRARVIFRLQGLMLLDRNKVKVCGSWLLRSSRQQWFPSKSSLLLKREGKPEEGREKEATGG